MGYRRQRFALPLFVLCLCGFLGVLIDLDHVVVAVQKIVGVVSGNMAALAGRPAHIPSVIVGGIVWLVVNTLALRFLYKTMVMNGKRIR